MKQPDHIRDKKSLKYLILDGSFWSVMDGFTANFIAPYALYLNASNLIISLLASVPDLIASFFQLIAIKINEIFSAKKKLIVIGAIIQACLWIPILFIPKVIPGNYQALWLIALYTCTIMIAYFNTPLWRGIVGDLVPEDQRGAYFSKRNRIIASVSFISSLTAGFILQSYKSDPFTGFAILFGVAFASRIISGLFLSMIYEKPVFKFSQHDYKSYNYTLLRFTRDLTKTDYGKFVLFVCLFRIAVAFSSPFFAVYELKHLGFSYMQYTIILAAEIIASVLSLSLWGKMNDEKGSKTVLIFSSLIIPIIPLAYLFSANFYFLLIISLFSGFAWAGFNLSIGNFMFDAASPQERVRYSSYFQLFHGVAIFIGAVSGGLLLNVLPDTKTSLLLIFAISGIERLAVALLLLPTLREMRLVELPFGKSFFEYPLIIKPRQRFVQDPFDYYLAYPKKPKKPRPRLYLDLVEKDPVIEFKKKRAEGKKFVDRMLGKDQAFNKAFRKK